MRVQTVQTQIRLLLSSLILALIKVMTINSKMKVNQYSVFSLPVQMYMKNHCNTPGVSVGSGLNVRKMLKPYV